MRQQGQYGDPSANTYVAAQMHHMAGQRVKTKSGNFEGRVEAFTLEREDPYANIKPEGHGDDASSSYFQGPRPDPKLALQNRSNGDSRSQAHEEDRDVGYEGSHLSLEGLEQNFHDVIIKLTKEQHDAEDAEHARHREKINAINTQCEKKLAALRARHSSRRAEFLRWESLTRQQQYQQIIRDPYSSSGMAPRDPHGYSNVNASAAGGEVQQGYSPDHFDPPYRERARFPGSARELHDSPSFELVNDELGSPMKREDYCSEMVRYNNNCRGNSMECDHEFTRTPPKKQIQKKSALLRIQTVKPNHRNHNVEQLRYAGYAPDSNSNFFRSKEQHGYIGHGMKAEEREESPMELDISFESNSLVAKAIVAPSSLGAPVSDSNLTPVSDLPCKTNDTSSAGKELSLQKNVVDTSSQPCAGNPRGKNEVAVSVEVADMCSGKSTPRTVKKKKIVKRVVKKTVVNPNSTVSSSLSENMQHGTVQADSVKLSSSTTLGPDKTETCLEEKSTNVDKVSVPEGNLLTEDKKGDISLPCLGPDCRSQECKTDKASDIRKVSRFERGGNISNSPSCSSSSEDLIDARNSADNRVCGFNKNDLTGSEENLIVTGNGNNGTVSKAYYENMAPTRTQSAILEEKLDIAIPLQISGNVAFSSSENTMIPLQSSVIVNFSSSGNTRIQDGLGCLQHASVLKPGSDNGSSNLEDSITVHHFGIMKDDNDDNNDSPLSKRKKVTASQKSFSQCQSEFSDAIVATTSNAEVPISFSDNQAHQKEKVALSSMGILSVAQSRPYSEDIAKLSDSILAAGSFESMDTNKEAMISEHLELQHSDIVSNSLCEVFAFPNVQLSVLEPEQKENITPIVPVSNTETDILVVGNIKDEKIDLQTVEENYRYKDFVRRSPRADMESNDFNVKDDLHTHQNFISCPADGDGVTTKKNGSKNQPGGVIHKTFQGNNPPTSLPRIKPLVGTVPPKRPILERKGNFQNTSYIRKGNSLVRKPTPVYALPQISSANQSPLDLNEIQKSTTSEDLADVTDQPIYLKTEANAPQKRQTTPPLPIDSKSEENISSRLVEPPSSGCCENASDTRKFIETNDAPNCSDDVPKHYETPENQTGPSNNGESQVETNDGNNSSLITKRIVYIKPKTNQLVAASNSCDVIISTDDKGQTAFSDGYYKRRKNQLVRTTFENHINQTAAMPNSTVNSDGHGASKVLCNKRFTKRQLKKANSGMRPASCDKAGGGAQKCWEWFEKPSTISGLELVKSKWGFTLHDAIAVIKAANPQCAVMEQDFLEGLTDRGCQRPVGVPENVGNVAGSSCKPSRASLVWTLHSKNSSENHRDSWNYQKILPHLFPWKRATYLRNFIHNSASSYNSSSLSAISKKLLLLRKRDAVYTRSTHGFSLWKSKVLGVGGSSLKWSKSIEKHSKKANEEATLAVAAVERKKREQKDVACIGSQAKRERIFRIGSVRYRMDPSRRTLQRISDGESLSSSSPCSSLASKRTYIPRRLVIGNDEYVRIGNGNQLIRDPKKRTRKLANEKVRWSLHTARQRLARKQKYCQFFTRFGKCNKGGGKCPYIHDPSKIAVCTKFLNGLCSTPKCKLTHKVL
ncbi:Zinc finger, CCCH-type [Sesbania bispinosa]|nr:Zinc finger, CCCH-type [Sesbania bispinosa]